MFKELGFPVVRIGLDAGPLSQWLVSGLTRAGFQAVLLETRHVKAALSAMTVKTDRKDARGLAQLIRMGWFRPVHTKSIGSQELRALLVARVNARSGPSAWRRGLSLVRKAKIELISGSNPGHPGNVAGAPCRAAPRAVSPPGS
jgi:transposase